MAKIVKNTGLVDKTWGGVTVLASTQYSLQEVDVIRFLSDSTFKSDLESLIAVVNDGITDLGITDGILWLHGYTANSIRIVDSNNIEVGVTPENRLKIETQFNYDNVDTDDISEGSTNLYFTTERSQDAVGNSLTDTSSINFTYDDVGNQIIADVIPSGVDHNSLQNFVANKHIDHLTVSISAGTGLSGGGDITASRTLDIANTGVVASSYGSATQTSTFTVNAQGQLTAAASTSIAIPSTQVTDFNEAAQDAIGNILADTSSIDFTYNDAGDTISATVLPAGVDHNSLANLTTGDPHTQYVKGPNSATDNAITRYDGTTGKLVQNSNATISDNGDIVADGYIRPGDTSDTTAGNIRFNSGELQVRQGSLWHVISGTATTVTATADTSTTSSTYSVINTMTITPSAGTYLVLFTATASLGDDTTADIGIFTNATEETSSTRRLAINASGVLGVVAKFEVSVAINTFLTVNGSQAINIRFRENGGGTLTVGPRRLTILPVVR